MEVWWCKIDLFAVWDSIQDTRSGSFASLVDVDILQLFLSRSRYVPKKLWWGLSSDCFAWRHEITFTHCSFSSAVITLIQTTSTQHVRRIISSRDGRRVQLQKDVRSRVLRRSPPRPHSPFHRQRSPLHQHKRAFRSHVVFAKDPPPHRRRPGDLGIAADMCRSLLAAYKKDSHEVPYRKWFQVIVRLPRCCTKAETIEVPEEWGEVQWDDSDFPEIDLSDFMQQKRQLNSERWRWGKDPIVLPQDWAGLMDAVREAEKKEKEDEAKDKRSLELC